MPENVYTRAPRNDADGDVQPSRYAIVPRTVLIAVLAGPLMGGCGQKGPLYLPPAPAAATNPRPGGLQSPGHERQRDRKQPAPPAP